MNFEEELTLVVSFPDQSRNFALGHEAGRIFEQLELESSGCFVLQTHFENREVIIRQAHHFGWAVEIIPTETDGWDCATFTKLENHRERVNPHGLRVVK
jgi:hypothetical protein